MFHCLAGRPWHVLCRVSLPHKAPLSQRSPRIPQLCHGESQICHQQRWARAVTPPRPKGSIVTRCVSQDGRVEAYTAGGSAYQSVVSPLRGWVRSSTTLPPETIKMFLRNHHRVVLQRLNRSYLPPLKVPHLQQAMQAKDLFF